MLPSNGKGLGSVLSLIGNVSFILSCNKDVGESIKNIYVKSQTTRTHGNLGVLFSRKVFSRLGSECGGSVCLVSSPNISVSFPQA